MRYGNWNPKSVYCQELTVAPCLNADRPRFLPSRHSGPQRLNSSLKVRQVKNQNGIFIITVCRRIQWARPGALERHPGGKLDMGPSQSADSFRSFRPRKNFLIPYD